MAQGQQADGRYVFLDYLRAGAAWLVVWDHLANIIPGWSGKVFRPAVWVRDNITAPLGIIQDFGWFGVALFFLISGFIISDRARVESAAEFSVKRLFRIYPMLALTVLLAVGLGAVPRSQATVETLLLNMTLANYLVVPQVVLVGVAWTLVIEMLFYVLTAVTQVARDTPHRIAFNLAVIALVVWRRGHYGPSFALLAASVGFLPVLAMGQTIYWWLARGRLSTPWGLAYLAASFGLFELSVRVVQPSFAPVTNSYMISVAYAVLLFLAMMRAPLKESRVVRLLSDTSYSLYLVHGIIGWLVLKVLIDHVDRAPVLVAVPLAAAASLAVAFVTYRLIETPVNRLARRLTRGARPKSVAPQTAGTQA